MSDKKKWITPRQAANTLGVSVQRVHQLAQKGVLTFRRVTPVSTGANGRPVSVHILKSDCQRRAALQPPRPQ